MPWIKDNSPDEEKISVKDYEKIKKQIEAYSTKKSWHNSHKLQLRFKGKFCYVDDLEKDGSVSPLGRLRYYGTNKWSIDFFTYSDERYKPCALRNGSLIGSIEKCIDVCEIYLV